MNRFSRHQGSNSRISVIGIREAPPTGWVLADPAARQSGLNPTALVNIACSSWAHRGGTIPYQEKCSAWPRRRIEWLSRLTLPRGLTAPCSTHRFHTGHLALSHCAPSWVPCTLTAACWWKFRPSLIIQDLRTARRRRSAHASVITVPLVPCPMITSGIPQRTVSIWLGGKTVLWLEGRLAAFAGLECGVDGLTCAMSKLADFGGAGETSLSST